MYCPAFIIKIFASVLNTFFCINFFSCLTIMICFLLKQEWDQILRPSSLEKSRIPIGRADVRETSSRSRNSTDQWRPVSPEGWERGQNHSGACRVLHQNCFGRKNWRLPFQSKHSSLTMPWTRPRFARELWYLQEQMGLYQEPNGEHLWTVGTDSGAVEGLRAQVPGDVRLDGHGWTKSGESFQRCFISRRFPQWETSLPGNIDFLDKYVQSDF